MRLSAFEGKDAAGVMRRAFLNFCLSDLLHGKQNKLNLPEGIMDLAKVPRSPLWPPARCAGLGAPEIVAENIANADTPRYRARDLVPFSALLSAARRCSRQNSPRTWLVPVARGSFPLEANSGAKASGNNVVLEEQDG